MKSFAILFCLFIVFSQSHAQEPGLSLARHFPQETQIYAESEFHSLAAIDAFSERLWALVSANESLPFSLHEGWSALLPGEASPATWAERLGDRVALGIADFAMATSTQLLALEITDFEATRQWLDDSLAAELSEGSIQRLVLPGRAVRYQPESELLGIAYEIHADVLLIASASKAFRAEDEATLWQNDALIRAYENGTTDGAAAILLVDGEALLLRALGEAMAQPAIAGSLPPLGQNWPVLIDAIGDAVLTFRHMAESQLYEIILNVTTNPKVEESFPSVEFSWLPEDELQLPTDWSLPPGTALAVSGNDLGNDLDQWMATISAWAGWLADSESLPPNLAWLATLETWLPWLIRSETGLEWESDLRAWMRGPYLALWEDEPPHFSLITRSVDSRAAETAFQQLRATLDFYDPGEAVFRPPLSLPPAWGSTPLAIHLQWDGQQAHLHATTEGNPSTEESGPDAAIHRFLNHRLPAAQLWLYLNGARLADWASAIDPSLGIIETLGDMSFALRWDWPVFTIQWLFESETFASPPTPSL
ncbi:MAG: hypothetical protein OXG02_08985 [Chloroflexi bacterium]|nr:hypothetical protein [Chloroflexota bacterium]